MTKVKATKEYELNNVSYSELNRIPKEGEEFEVSESRLEVLLGRNKWKKAFVVVVKEEEDKPKEKKSFYKPEHKAILKEDKKINNVKKSVLSD